MFGSRYVSNSPNNLAVTPQSTQQTTCKVFASFTHNSSALVSNQPTLGQVALCAHSVARIANSPCQCCSSLHW